MDGLEVGGGLSICSKVGWATKNADEINITSGKGVI